MSAAHLITKAKLVGENEDQLRWSCPGCDSEHVVVVAKADAVNASTVWVFNYDLERPTLTPSVLVNGIRGTSTEEWNRMHPRCHSFVRDGSIQFLSDCEHDLAGLTVPMIEVAR